MVVARMRVGKPTLTVISPVSFRMLNTFAAGELIVDGAKLYVTWPLRPSSASCASSRMMTVPGGVFSTTLTSNVGPPTNTGLLSFESITLTRIDVVPVLAWGPPSTAISVMRCCTWVSRSSCSFRINFTCTRFDKLVRVQCSVIMRCIIAQQHHVHNITYRSERNQFQ